MITVSSHVSFFIGGCSGSDTPSAPRICYGDHTTALGIRIGDAFFAVDNGSGVRRVARYADRVSPSRAYVLQTHLHADHLSGLCKNSLLLRKDFVRGLWSPRLGARTLKDEYEWVSHSSHWPMSPSVLGIEHSFYEFDPGTELDLDGIRVATLLLPHPSGSAAYRVETPAGGVVIATDVELADEEAQTRFAAFVSGAALLYLDCQFRDREYEGAVAIGEEKAGVPRVGWGHSTPSMIARTLARAHLLPKRLLLGHHDPMRDDLDLHRFEHEVYEQLAPIAARGTYGCGKRDLMLVSFATEGYQDLYYL